LRPTLQSCILLDTAKNYHCDLRVKTPKFAVLFGTAEAVPSRS
jgi:hypothetical protein